MRWSSGSCFSSPSILFPTFEAPAWVMKVFIALVAAGFPIALVVAWAFELTPEGIKRTDEIQFVRGKTGEISRLDLRGAGRRGVVRSGCSSSGGIQPADRARPARAKSRSPCCHW